MKIKFKTENAKHHGGWTDWVFPTPSLIFTHRDIFSGTPFVRFFHK